MPPVITSLRAMGGLCQLRLLGIRATLANADAWTSADVRLAAGKAPAQPDPRYPGAPLKHYGGRVEIG